MLTEINTENGADILLHKLAEQCKTEFSGELYGAEFGVAYGGGVQNIARIWKDRGTVWGFDTFEGMPKQLALIDPYVIEAGGLNSRVATCMDVWYNKSEHGLDKCKYDYIRSNLDAQGLTNAILIKGLITEKTDLSFIPKLHYAFIDMDFPLSQWNGYNLVKNKIISGGYLCMHDMLPESHLHGCYEQYQRILQEKLFDVVAEYPKSHLVILKRKSKVIFVSHCQNDWYYKVGADKLKSSARFFHPNVELLVHGDNIISEIKQKYPWSSWYTFDPLVSEYHINDYDMIVHFDADSIITGSLDELLLGDFDLAGVRTNNDVGICTTTGRPYKDINKHLNAGLIASTNKEFWKEFKECNSRLTSTGPGINYGEQDTWNEIFYSGKYKTKLLDPIDSNVYYGVSQQICEPGGQVETAWKRLYMSHDKLMSDGKEVKVIHNADGHRLPKLQYQNWVKPEVKHFLDTITQ